MTVEEIERWRETLVGYYLRASQTAAVEQVNAIFDLAIKGSQLPQSGPAWVK